MNELSLEGKYDYWQQIIEKFENSGLPIREQCRARDIPFWKYYEWRKRIKKMSSGSDDSFVEIKEVYSLPMVKEINSSGVHLECGKGFKVILEENFNPSVLSSLIQVLRFS